MAIKKLKYAIIRSRDAGCFAGEIESRKGDCVVMVKARRLWYWSGAASLSQMAEEGVSNPSGCKFPAPVARQEILGVIEILDVTSKCRASIESVPVWRA